MSHINKATETGNRYDFIVCNNENVCTHESDDIDHRFYRFDRTIETGVDGASVVGGPTVDEMIDEIRNYERGRVQTIESVELTNIKASKLEAPPRE